MGAPVRPNGEARTIVGGSPGRFTLGLWTPDDWRALHPIVTDGEVMQFVGDGSPWTEQLTQAFVDFQIASQRDNGFCQWALHADGQLAGFCGLRRSAQLPEYVEIGWRLRRSCWGRGLATEAARLALDLAFRSHRLPAVLAVVQLANQRSLRVVEKLGMELFRTGLRGNRDIGYFRLHNPLLPNAPSAD